jgi:hypothetical protein
MAGIDFVFNIGKGAVAEKIRDGANLGILVLQTTGLEADETLRDYDTVAAMLAGTSDEPTNTGYARKTVANAGVTLTVDDTNNRVDLDFADQLWAGVAAAGGTWAKVVVYEDVGGADASRVPLCAYTFDITPDGSDVSMIVNAAGWYRAS